MTGTAESVIVNGFSVTLLFPIGGFAQTEKRFPAYDSSSCEPVSQWIGAVEFLQESDEDLTDDQAQRFLLRVVALTQLFLFSLWLIKDNSGTLLLTSPSNTHSGPIQISAGTLNVSSGGRLGNGSYSSPIANYATFIYSSTATQILSGVISGTGTLTKSGSGSLTLSAANTYSGNTLSDSISPIREPVCQVSGIQVSSTGRTCASP